MADLEKQNESANGSTLAGTSQNGVAGDNNEPRKSSLSGMQRLKAYYGQELSMNHVDMVLFVLCFITGLTDATMFNAYGTFVSMQTGNTIFVALGASHQNAKPYGWALSLISTVFFVAGAFSFARTNNALGPKRRVALTLSFAVQSTLIVLAAALAEARIVEGQVPEAAPPPGQAVSWSEVAPIALLSFQAAGQIACTRAVGVAEVPTVVITTLLCDLFGDPGLFAGFSENIKRNRRAVGFTMTLVGGLVGGWVSKRSGNIGPALWIGAGLKVLIIGAWSVWHEKSDDGDK